MCAASRWVLVEMKYSWCRQRSACLLGVLHWMHVWATVEHHHVYVDCYSKLPATGCRPSDVQSMLGWQGKTAAVTTTDGWLNLDFARCVIRRIPGSCVIRQTRSLGALVLCSNWKTICNMVFVNYIHDMVVDTQFHKFLYLYVCRRAVPIPNSRYITVSKLLEHTLNSAVLTVRSSVVC